MSTITVMNVKIV